jgi:hypothetical protein
MCYMEKLDTYTCSPLVSEHPFSQRFFIPVLPGSDADIKDHEVRFWMSTNGSGAKHASLQGNFVSEEN